MTLRFERELSLLMGTLAGGIFLGTVYGGFHYGVDALAGLVVGIALSLVGPALHSVLLRQARLWPLRFRFPHLFGPIVAKLWGLRARDDVNSSSRRTSL
jgi:membrane-associated phospholipid phosphatase